MTGYNNTLSCIADFLQCYCEQPHFLICGNYYIYNDVSSSRYEPSTSPRTMPLITGKFVTIIIDSLLHSVAPALPVQHFHDIPVYPCAKLRSW